MAHGGELLVSQYLVGRDGVAARLSTATLLPRALHLLRLATRPSGYVIPWTWMDLTDPEHPRCTRPEADLQGIADQEPPYLPKDGG